jgi:hypothetical protein
MCCGPLYDSYLLSRQFFGASRHDIYGDGRALSVPIVIVMILFMSPNITTTERLRLRAAHDHQRKRHPPDQQLRDRKETGERECVFSNRGCRMDRSDRANAKALRPFMRGGIAHKKPERQWNGRPTGPRRVPEVRATGALRIIRAGNRQRAGISPEERRSDD